MQIARLITFIAIFPLLGGCLGEGDPQPGTGDCIDAEAGCTVPPVGNKTDDGMAEVDVSHRMIVNRTDETGSFALDWPAGTGNVTVWLDWTVYKFTPIQIVWIPETGELENYPGVPPEAVWSEFDGRYALVGEGWVTAHHDDVGYEAPSIDERDRVFLPVSADVPPGLSGTVVVTWANVPGGVSAYINHEDSPVTVVQTGDVSAWAFGQWDEGTEVWTPAVLASFNDGVRFGSEDKHTLVNVVVWASNQAVGQLDIQSGDATDTVPLREDNLDGCVCSYGHRYLGLYEGEVEMTLIAAATTAQFVIGQSTLLYVTLTEVELDPATTQRLTEVPYDDRTWEEMD